MFTGIVKAIGTVASVESRGGDLRLRIHAPGLNWRSFDAGESICVNGICLTAVGIAREGFDTDVSTETLQVTALADVSPGDRVNVEPSLEVGERMGGHLVSGHVDCVGEVRSLRRDARSLRLEIGMPAEFSRYVARKGSICVDGVSLTTNSVSADAFSLNIIPHTAESTIIGAYRVGTKVNIEVDLLARYIARLLSQDEHDSISMELLREHGYAK